jgi:hypothetical protein
MLIDAVIEPTLDSTPKDSGVPSPPILLSGTSVVHAIGLKID